MKNLLKVAVFLFIAGAILISGSNIFAQNQPIAKPPYPTTNNSKLTNLMVCTGANFVVRRTNNVTNVRLIAGGNWPASADISNALAGGIYSNVSFISNWGNYRMTFRIGVDQFATNINTGPAWCGGSWLWTIYTNFQGSPAYLTGRGAVAAPVGLGLALNMGASKKVIFVVKVTNTAVDMSWEQWRLFATNMSGDLIINTNRYLGDNNLWYGGSYTNGWGAGRTHSLTWFDTGGDNTYPYPAANVTNNNDWRWRVRVSAPIIWISKRIAAISDVSKTGQNLPIPGASITYEIFITNRGSGAATGLVLRDYIPTTFLSNNITWFTCVYAGSTETNWGKRYIPGSPKGTVVFSNQDVNGFNGYAKARLQFRAIIK